MLPNATQAAYWTERAAKHVEAGHTQVGGPQTGAIGAGVLGLA